MVELLIAAVVGNSDTTDCTGTAVVAATTRSQVNTYIILFREIIDVPQTQTHDDANHVMSCTKTHVCYLSIQPFHPCIAMALPLENYQSLSFLVSFVTIALPIIQSII